MPAHVAFAVHPLVPWQRRLLGVRHRDLDLLWGRPSDRVRRIGSLRLSTAKGPARIDIIGVPDLPRALVADQRRAVDLQRQALEVAVASGAQALGWGSALAVVGGRGEVAAAAAPIPVTTGHAATAWACSELVRQVSGGEPVGVLGFRSTVGDAVAALLAEDHEVRVAARGAADSRRARALGVHAQPRTRVLQGCRVVVGASTTGPSLDPSALYPGTVLLDLANPPTLRPGPWPVGVVVLAGETLAWPGKVHGGVWGRLWRRFAGYEGGLAYACLAEPLVLDRTHVGGRRLQVDTVRKVGQALTELGFTPTLHRRLTPPARLAR